MRQTGDFFFPYTVGSISFKCCTHEYWAYLNSPALKTTFSARMQGAHCILGQLCPDDNILGTHEKWALHIGKSMP